MQTRNPLLNDFAELMTDAFGAAQAAGEEARTAFRGQADRFIADMDLVSREEFDVVKTALATARGDIAALEARLAALEAGPAAKPVPVRKRRTTAKKPAKPQSTN